MSIIHRGYCRKSPPQESFSSSRWHRRLCTLTVADNGNIEHVYKKRDKAYRNKDRIIRQDLRSPVEYLVFSYYKDEVNEEKGNPIKQFIMDDAMVEDKPGGEHGYKFAIKIILSANYNSRILFLCFDQTEDHEIWLSIFSEYLKQYHRTFSIDLSADEKSEKYQPCKNNSLQTKIQKYRQEIEEEREEKKRLSLLPQEFISEEPESREYDEDLEYMIPLPSLETYKQPSFEMNDDDANTSNNNNDVQCKNV